MGEAFKYFSKNEALVVGVYRNVKSAGAKKKRTNERRGASSATTDANSEGATVTVNESSDSAPSANGSSGGDDSGDDMASEEESEEELVDGKPRAKPEHDYVLTAPPHTVRLNPTDKLYVIATTDWAWVNVPEMVELRKTSAVICLQRQFRAKSDRRKEEEREEKLAEFPGERLQTERDFLPAKANDCRRVAVVPRPRARRIKSRRRRRRWRRSENPFDVVRSPSFDVVRVHHSMS